VLTSAFFAFWFSIFTLRFSAFLLCGKHLSSRFSSLAFRKSFISWASVTKYTGNPWAMASIAMATAKWVPAVTNDILLRGLTQVIGLMKQEILSGLRMTVLQEHLRMLLLNQEHKLIDMDMNQEVSHHQLEHLTINARLHQELKVNHIMYTKL